MCETIFRIYRISGIQIWHEYCAAMRIKIHLSNALNYINAVSAGACHRWIWAGYFLKSKNQGELIVRPGTDMYGYDLGQVILSLEDCEDLCFSLNNCVAFVRRKSEGQSEGGCWPWVKQSGPLWLVEECRGSALIGREDHSVAPPARVFACSLLVLYGIRDRWLQCTERSYYRRPYAIKNQRRASKDPFQSP